MKGTKKNEVYIFDGDVITSEANVTLKQAKDTTRLWHLRLGHMSEKNLKS